MANGMRSDPFTAFRFQVEIDGLIIAGFSDVSGLQAETKTYQYREGGVNNFVHKFPDCTEYPNLVLKRGLGGSDELWKWHREVVNGRFNRKNGSVLLLDDTGQVKWRWNFSMAYPVKWVGPELKADSNTVAFESVELVHQGIEKG